MSLNREIGERVRDRRIALGLAQEDLAALVGLHQTMVSKTEAGARRLKADELPAFCSALRMTFAELLGIEDAESAGSHITPTNELIEDARLGRLIRSVVAEQARRNTEEK